MSRLQLPMSVLHERENFAQSAGELGDFAQEVLRTRGGLMYVSSDYDAGIEGQIAGPMPGILKIQGTEPIEVTPRSFVALRNSDESEAWNDVLLVETQDNYEGYLRQNTSQTRVLARLGGSGLVLAGGRPPTDKKQVDAVRSVIAEINSSLSPIVATGVEMGPEPSDFSPFEAGKIYSLSHTQVINDPVVISS